jgi:Flp pilus assembly pilin Flp
MMIGLIEAMLALRPRGMWRDDRGAVSTEYAVMLSLIALVLIAALTAFGLAVSGLLDRGTAAF